MPPRTPTYSPDLDPIARSFLADASSEVGQIYTEADVRSLCYEIQQCIEDWLANTFGAPPNAA
jgi:hypothetical protein